LNNNLFELFSQKNRLKKAKDKYSRQFYYYTIFPWLILGFTLLLNLFVNFMFELD